MCVASDFNEVLSQDEKGGKSRKVNHSVLREIHSHGVINTQTILLQKRDSTDLWQAMSGSICSKESKWKV